MTRAQYIAMCLIGGLALVAFLQSYEVAKVLRGSGAPPKKNKLLV